MTREAEGCVCLLRNRAELYVFVHLFSCLSGTCFGVVVVCARSRTHAKPKEQCFSSASKLVLNCLLSACFHVSAAQEHSRGAFKTGRHACTWPHSEHVYCEMFLAIFNSVDVSVCL